VSEEKKKGEMMFAHNKYLVLGLIMVFALISFNCAPGNDRWNQEVNPGHRAGFWAGIWHGLIVIITFIVSLFTNEVGLYEINNTGWPYNFGFLIGLLVSLGGGCRVSRGKKKMKKSDWKKVGDEIEERVLKGIKTWLDETKEKDREKEWEEIASKIEEKIKKTLKDWAEK
jgi:hypothetical protein